MRLSFGFVLNSTFSGNDKNEEIVVEEELKDEIPIKDSWVKMKRPEATENRETVCVTESTELRRHARNADQMRILKTTLRMNLVTIVLLLFLLPRHILAIYNYQCYLSEGGCSNYLLFFNRVAFLQICVTFILPLVVVCTIDKIA